MELTQNASPIDVDDDITRCEFSVLVSDAIWNDGFDLQKLFVFIVTTNDGEAEAARTLIGGNADRQHARGKVFYNNYKLTKCLKSCKDKRSKTR